MNSFFKSQFSPLVLICHNRTINNKIHHLHERCLRVIYSAKISLFKELLERDGSVPICSRNLQILAIEMFKAYSNIALPIFTDIFYKQNPNYQLHHTSDFSVAPVRSVYNGTENLSFLGPKILGYCANRVERSENCKRF